MDMAQPQPNSRYLWAQVENSDIWKDVIRPHLEDKIKDINYRMYQATEADERSVLQGELIATMDLLNQPRTETEMADINALMERDLPDGSGRRTRFRRSAR
jgi:hypothetical protein